MTTLPALEASPALVALGWDRFAELVSEEKTVDREPAGYTDDKLKGNYPKLLLQRGRTKLSTTQKLKSRWLTRGGECLADLQSFTFLRLFLFRWEEQACAEAPAHNPDTGVSNPGIAARFPRSGEHKPTRWLVPQPPRAKIKHTANPRRLAQA